MITARFGYVIPGPTDPTQRSPGSEPARSQQAADLAGRWLSRFLTGHLAAERDLSAADHRVLPRRDQAAAHLVPRRAGNPAREGSASPTSTGRGCWRSCSGCKPSAATRHRPEISAWPRSNRSSATPPSSGRSSSARPPRSSLSSRRGPQSADMAHLSGDEVKALLAEPDPATRRGQRDIGLAVHALRHRRPRSRDLRPEHLRRPRLPARRW